VRVVLLVKLVGKVACAWLNLPLAPPVSPAATRSTPPPSAEAVITTPAPATATAAAAATATHATALHDACHELHAVTEGGHAVLQQAGLTLAFGTHGGVQRLVSGAALGRSPRGEVRQPYIHDLWGSTRQTHKHAHMQNT